MNIISINKCHNCFWHLNAIKPVEAVLMKAAKPSRWAIARKRQTGIYLILIWKEISVAVKEIILIFTNLNNISKQDHDWDFCGNS